MRLITEKIVLSIIAHREFTVHRSRYRDDQTRRLLRKMEQRGLIEFAGVHRRLLVYRKK